MGIPPDPRRNDETRRDGRAVHGLGDPARRGHRSGTAPPGPDLAAVPARPGCRDPSPSASSTWTPCCSSACTSWCSSSMAPGGMHLGGVTASPTGEWTVQQARNLSLTLGEGPGDIRFLIRDRGSDFTASFDAVFQAAGTRILRTAVRTPRMNAICERLAGTLRRELLDRVLILGEQHLHAVLARIPGALQHRPAPPRHRATRPRRRTRRSPRHRDRHRHTTDPPETYPQRPDQRVHARRLKDRTPAGPQPMKAHNG